MSAAAIRRHRRRHGRHPDRDQAAGGRASTTSSSTRRPTGSAAPGARTRTPASRCDVPSHLYSYSFAPNPDWSHRFSPGPEIQAYFEGVARAHGVGAALRFGDGGGALRRSSDGRWQLETTDGDRDEADVVIAATGVLHHPNVPEIEGLERFAGALFHSARWDHSVPLDGRARRRRRHRARPRCRSSRRIADRVAKLSLFQRTRAVDHAAGEPALRRGRARGVPARPRAPRASCAQRSSARSSRRASRTRLVDADSPQMQMIEAACLANLETNVRDPGAAREAAPELPRGVQAARHLAQLLRGDPAAERRARHRRHRAGRAARRAHARRAPARARRARARDRLPRRPLPAPDRGGRAAAA